MNLSMLFSPYELLGAHLSLLLGACFLLLAPLFARFSAGALKSVAALAIAIAFVVFLSVGAAQNAGGFFGLYLHDGVAYVSSLLILASSFLFVLLRKDVFLDGEFLGLFLLLVTCLIFMVSSTNLVMIFISLEGSSLALYALIAHKHKATNAAIGYFNYGMLGSAFFAMASAVYYYETGSLFLNANIANSDFGLLSSLMFLCVVLYKLSVAPFHMWLGKVYEDAEGALAGFVSVVPKIAMAVFAYRLACVLELFSLVAMIIASLAMIYASLRSLGANNARNMLVYSSISHSSFVLVAACLAQAGAFLYYFAAFAFINMALFLILESVKNSSYDKLCLSIKSQPFVAFFTIIMLLDLAALPPFGVFFAKVIAIGAAYQASVCIALAMAISSVIMLFAYLRFISALIKGGDGLQTIHFSPSTKVALFIALAASLLASFNADYLFGSLF